MSYTFRVIFDGVCAYVPEKPFFQEKIPKERPQGTGLTDPNGYFPPRWSSASPKDLRSMAVLLPDLRRPGTPVVPTFPKLNFPSFRAPHFPLIKFRLDDLREGTTRRVDLVCRDISRRDEEGLLFLRREQIRFSMEAENEDEFSFAGWTPTNFHQGLPDPASREETESLWWLPDLKRILPERQQPAARVRHDVLPSYRGPFPEGLIARVECNGGRLRTYDFNRDVDSQAIQWRFAKPSDSLTDGYWNRALANSVALEFFDVRSEVRIELKRLANEVVTETLVLAPGPGASREVLEIEITNREPEMLFQQEGFGRLTLPDMDFQPFYEQLSADHGDISELPVPHPGRFSFFGIREKPCAGTEMAVSL